MIQRWGVLVLALGLVMLAPTGQAQEQVVIPQRVSNEEQSQPQVLPIPLPVEVVESESSTNARLRNEKEAAEREISDLVAQQGMHLASEAMNDATQRMANYTLWSTWIVGFGTALLIWTLFETRRANSSAQEAVDITREIGEAQLRAYAGLSKGYMDRDGVHMFFRNSGQTPAFDVCISTKFRYADIHGEPFIERQQDSSARTYWRHRSPGVIDPGELFYAHMKILDEDFQAIEAETRWAEVSVEVLYTTRNRKFRRFGDYAIRPQFRDKEGRAKLISTNESGETEEPMC